MQVVISLYLHMTSRQITHDHMMLRSMELSNTLYGQVWLDCDTFNTGCYMYTEFSHLPVHHQLTKEMIESHLLFHSCRGQIGRATLVNSSVCPPFVCFQIH
jgi:hypothetical protein